MPLRVIALLLVWTVGASAQTHVIAHVCTWHVKGAWHEASTIPWRSDGAGIGYDADDPAVIARQATEMRDHGITPLLSWWGPAAPHGGDGYLDVWSDTVTALPAAILYEGEGRLRRDPDGWWDLEARDNAERLRADLTHLYEKYWSATASQWYQRRGKFVVYLWPAHAMRGDLASVLRPLPFRDRLYVVGTEFDALRMPTEARAPLVGGLDAVTGYGFYGKPLMEEYGRELSDALIAKYRLAALSWRSYLAARHPGVDLILPLEFAFDDHGVPGRGNPVYEASPEQAAKLLAEMRQLIDYYHTYCGNLVPAITVASYNEHFEGTALEPNTRFGRLWLDAVTDWIARPPLPQPRCE